MYDNRRLLVQFFTLNGAKIMAHTTIRQSIQIRIGTMPSFSATHPQFSGGRITITQLLRNPVISGDVARQAFQGTTFSPSLDCPKAVGVQSGHTPYYAG